MTFLWWNLAIVFIFSFFARYFSNPVIVNGVPIKLRPNRLLVVGVMVSLVVIAGLRKNIGDTFFYMHSFKVSTFTWDSIVKDKDFGFGILQMLLKNYSTDPQTLIFITALITNILIVLILSRYSGFFELSTYAYITGGLFLVSMNGIRQVLAAAIIFTATRFIISGVPPWGGNRRRRGGCRPWRGPAPPPAPASRRRPDRAASPPAPCRG